MAGSEQVALNSEILAAVQALAHEQHRAPDEIANEALAEGLNILRQRLFFNERRQQAFARGASLNDALSILRRAGTEAPLPSDEIAD